MASPGPTPQPDAGGGGKSKTPLIIGLVVGFVVLCMGLPVVGGGVWYFLLSDDAGFITGQTISVSGGLTMHG